MLTVSWAINSIESTRVLTAASLNFNGSLILPARYAIPAIACGTQIRAIPRALANLTERDKLLSLYRLVIDGGCFMSRDGLLEWQSTHLKSTRYASRVRRLRANARVYRFLRKDIHEIILWVNPWGTHVNRIQSMIAIITPRQTRTCRRSVLSST